MAHYPTGKLGKRIGNIRKTWGSAQMQRFYKSWSWKQLSKRQLMRTPLCQICRKKAKTVPAVLADHYYPVRLFPELKQAEFNLWSLCTPCHNTKSADERNITTRSQMQTMLDTKYQQYR